MFVTFYGASLSFSWYKWITHIVMLKIWKVMFIDWDFDVIDNLMSVSKYIYEIYYVYHIGNYPTFIRRNHSLKIKGELNVSVLKPFKIPL